MTHLFPAEGTVAETAATTLELLVFANVTPCAALLIVYLIHCHLLDELFLIDQILIGLKNALIK